MKRTYSSQSGVHPSTGADFFQRIANILLECTAEDEPDTRYIKEEFTELLNRWDEMGKGIQQSEDNHFIIEFNATKLTLRFSVIVEEVPEE